MARWISTSIVARPGPPRIRTTPKEVKVNRKTIAAEAAMAGLSSGRDTSRKVRQREAPSTRAASSSRGSSIDHRPPTVRTTTA